AADALRRGDRKEFVKNVVLGITAAMSSLKIPSGATGGAGAARAKGAFQIKGTFKPRSLPPRSSGGPNGPFNGGFNPKGPVLRMAQPGAQNAAAVPAATRGPCFTAEM